MKALGLVLGFLVFTSAQLALATDAIPNCDNRGSILPIDNQNALNMEKTTANQFTTQAHVEGTVTAIYPNHSGHQHFAIQLGSDSSQGIEVVYDMAFGNLPALQVGQTVEACGEFINSFAATSQYPPSPMGAIIHWVHINDSTKPGAHPSGFLVIDGQLCGQNPAQWNSAHHNGN